MMLAKQDRTEFEASAKDALSQVRCNVDAYSMLCMCMVHAKRIACV